MEGPHGEIAYRHRINVSRKSKRTTSARSSARMADQTCSPLLRLNDLDAFPQAEVFQSLPEHKNHRTFIAGWVLAGSPDELLGKTHNLVRAIIDFTKCAFDALVNVAHALSRPVTLLDGS